MVKDSDVSSKLLEEIQNLISNANERELLGENILKMAKPNATEEIVSHILKELNFE